MGADVMTGIQFTFEDPTPSLRGKGHKSPLEQLVETIEKNEGRWLKLAGRKASAPWAKRKGYEVTVRGKDLYLRKPAPVQLAPGLLPTPPKRGRPGMRVVGIPSLADEMDAAGIGTR